MNIPSEDGLSSRHAEWSVRVDLDGSLYDDPCPHSDLVNGTRLCSEAPSSVESVVGPADDPGDRWPLGSTALFFACDPDGDGIQAICTGEGYDEPPFDGVLDHHWPEPVNLSNPIDRPGLPPLIGPWLALSPDVADVADQTRRHSDSRIDGEPWLVMRSDQGRRVIRATAEVEAFDLPNTDPDLFYSVVGRFLEGEDLWLLSLDEERGLLTDLQGRIKGHVEHTSDLERFGAGSMVGPDLDGDGINEIVMSNDADVYLWRLVER